jgi:hypothetical protein
MHKVSFGKKVKVLLLAGKTKGLDLFRSVSIAFKTSVPELGIDTSRVLEIYSVYQ